MNNKGLELSMTVIVVIIISIIVFIASIAITFNLYKETEDITAKVESSTEKEIEALVRDTNSLVAIQSVNTKKAKIGQPVKFGLGIRNIDNPRKFTISVSFDDAFEQSGQRITVEKSEIEEKWLGGFKEQTTPALQTEELKVFPVVIKPSSSIGTEHTKKGSYVFLICVFENEQPGLDCASEALNQDSLYSRKAYQVIVEI